MSESTLYCRAGPRSIGPPRGGVCRVFRVKGEEGMGSRDAGFELRVKGFGFRVEKVSG